MLRRWAVVGALALFGCESLRKPAPPESRHEDKSTDTRPVGRPGRAVPETARKGRPTEVVAASAKQDGESPSKTAEQAQLPTSSLQTEDKAGEGSSLTPATATTPEQPQPDHLTLVAECLERGDRANAAVHLEAYVRQHPEQLMFRLQLAEMLSQIGRDAHAKTHYERFALDAQHASAAVKNHLVHVHTRLMEIGLHAGDRFAEAFHRGVGLLLLAAEEDGKADADAAFCEEMLCKALKALAEAKELKTNDARVRMHLADAYDRTGNRRAAEAERAAARSAVVPEGVRLMLPR